VSPFKWLVYYDPQEVVPENDLRQHHHGIGCWCAPHFDGDVLVHNALDNRVAYENEKLH